MLDRLISLVTVLALIAGTGSAWGASIAGNWSSPDGDVIFTQDGAGIRGDATFPQGGTAKIVGVQLDNEFYFSYVRNTGRFGTGKMVLSDDENELHGTYSDQGSGREGEWTLTRGSAVPSEDSASETEVAVAGHWHSNLGETTFEQSGTHVTGTITFVNEHTGTVEGDLADRVLTFTYQLSAGEHGHGELTLSPDGATLRGTYQKLPSGEGGVWILISVEEESADSEEPATTETFPIAGRWNTNIGIVEFHSDGDHVTGTLAFSNGQRAWIEGTMIHNVLEFKYDHDNGSTGRGRIEVSDADTMKGAYHDSRTGNESVWRLHRLHD